MNKNSKIAILGAGLEGKAMEAYLQKHGHTDITILDEKEDSEAFADLSGYEIVFRSPGIPVMRPDLQAVKEKLSSVTRYFMEHCPCPIIGVTGTKGKGTTSTLIFKMLEAAGQHAFLGGNIGEPAVNFLDELTPNSIVVLEMSSFQLEDCDRSPHISVVLNISSEHLDYHPTVEAYRMAKRPIMEHQTEEDIAILNADYYGSFDMGRFTQGQIRHYSTNSSTNICLNGENILVDGETVASTQDIALRGPHNLENVLPACGVAKLLGVPNDKIRKTLQSFTGLPHRLELVGEKEGVQYFNDSFSTTPETSIAGMRSFTEPLILIAGGSDKGADFTEWGQAVDESTNLKALLLIGERAEALQATTKTEAHMCSDLESAFQWCQENANAGDVVLLSPACASFDQYENYKKRGEHFRQLAANIQEQ